MTLHKLSAGDGYTYLTRQVAAGDTRRPAGAALSAYYAESGNPPGRWVGSGAVELGLSGPVTEPQMRSLFGQGRHPEAAAIAAAVLAAGGSISRAEREGRLGRPFAPVLGPGGERRLPVAGYDLVFTPVKSLSVLWALGDPAVREAVLAAHHAAVGSAIRFLEAHAAFTRIGRGGLAQVDTYGLVAAAFDHPDSRLGDPDLHTHVAVANKVRARSSDVSVDGRWLALDGRALYAAAVAASERYNTRIEAELTRRLGVVFTERPGPAGRRPVRELAAMPPALLARFSRRRSEIEARSAVLAAGYRDRHGRAPDRAAQLALAQQATLETREGKPPARSLADQRAEWRQAAAELLGGPAIVDLVIQRVLTAAACTPSPHDARAGDVQSLAARVVGRLEEERATWTVLNVYAETERTIRGLRPLDPGDTSSPGGLDGLVEAVVASACGAARSVRLGPDPCDAAPGTLRRMGGESALRPHAATRFSSARTLAAEADLIAALHETTRHHGDRARLERRLRQVECGLGRAPDPGQKALALGFVADPARLVVGIGPAGSGKTTALRAACALWGAEGKRVLPLAASAAAAEVLAAELGVRAENLHKYTHALDHPDTVTGDPFYALRPGDVLLVDEAGLAGTHRLARLLAHAAAADAQLRLVGDPAQLDAVEAGGALRLLAREVEPLRLHVLHRFTDPAYAAATLALRAGDPDAIGFFTHHRRLRGGTADEMLDAAFAAWRADLLAGRVAVMLATDTAHVAELAARARLDRIVLGAVDPGPAVPLADGNRASAGDWVITRTNQRHLTHGRGGSAFVKNGDLWQVDTVHPDGSLSVSHLRRGGQVRLPAPYVAASVQLGYATTAHRAQGLTVDAAHAVLTETTSREALYVMATRARHTTTLYAICEQLIDPATEHAPPTPLTPAGLMRQVLARESAERSATETLRAALPTPPNLAPAPAPAPPPPARRVTGRSEPAGRTY